MERNVIEMNEIRKTFSNGSIQTNALNGVNLSIRAGEYVAISGPSGCGKSTLLSLIGLLDIPSSGTYKLLDDEVTTAGFSHRCLLRNQHIGFVFQNFNLVGDLTVMQNVELPLVYRGMKAGERKEKVEAMLDMVSMSDRAAYYPSQLSGGQQQRLAVARAFVTEPELVLADEPTGNLDTAQAIKIMELLDDLHQRGATICLVTHDPRYVEYAKRKVDLLDGIIVKDAPVDEIQTPSMQAVGGE